MLIKLYFPREGEFVPFFWDPKAPAPPGAKQTCWLQEALGKGREVDPVRMRGMVPGSGWGVSQKLPQRSGQWQGPDLVPGLGRSSHAILLLKQGCLEHIA